MHAGTPSERSALIIWKFTLPAPDAKSRAVVSIPICALPFSAGIQDDQLVVWATVDSTDQTAEPRQFIVANTGREIPDFPVVTTFLGTVTSSTGIVWHVWHEWDEA